MSNESPHDDVAAPLLWKALAKALVDKCVLTFDETLAPYMQRTIPSLRIILIARG